MENFEGCSFLLKEKKLLGPSKRWGHTAVLQNDHMLVFGGNTENPPKSGVEPVFRLNLRTWEFERLDAEGGPAPRDSHSCVLLGNKMFVWGGCTAQQTRNDMYCFDGTTWRRIHQQGQVPASRESQVAVGLEDRWIFLYGGCKDKQHFSDIFLFDSQSNYWFELRELKDKLPSRENASACIIKGQIVVFGGLDHKGKQTNDMYRIGLKLPSKLNSPNDLQPRVEEISYYNSAPSARAGHCTIAYRNRYIIVLGGQTDLSIGTHKKSRVEILNEVWLFDTETRVWQQLRPQNSGAFTRRNNFTAVLYGDAIVVFGGLQSPGGELMSDQLIVLNLSQNRSLPIIDKLKDKLCSICDVSLRFLGGTEEKETLIVEESPEPYNLAGQQYMDYYTAKEIAMGIAHPFQAIQTIVDCLCQQGSSLIEINYDSQSPQPCFAIESDGRAYNQEELQSWLSNPCQNQTKFDQRLLYSCLRLCRCFIIVHTDEDYYRIAMVSITRSFILSYQRDSRGIDMSDQMNFQAVDSMFKQYGLWEKIGSSSQQLFLLDLEMHPLATGKLELLSRGNNIVTSYRLQQQLPSSISECPFFDRTLSEHLRYYFLEPPQGICLSINQTQVTLECFKNSIVEDADEGEKCSIEDKSGMLVVLAPQRKNCRIFYYHRNKRICIYNLNFKDRYSGYVVLPDEMPQDHLGITLEDSSYLSATSSFIELQISSLAASQGTLKRPPVTALEILTEESKISTPILSTL